MHNDPVLSDVVTRGLEDAGFVPGAELRSCGADDFAFYGTHFPSLMVFAGTGDPAAPGLHHPEFLPPDEAVEQLARIMLTAYAAVAEMFRGTASDTVPDPASIPNTRNAGSD
jgi:amidohydrolase